MTVSQRFNVSLAVHEGFWPRVFRVVSFLLAMDFEALVV